MKTEQRYVSIPEPIRVAGNTISLPEVVALLVEQDARFNSSGKGIRAGVRIEEAFNGALALAVLRADDHALLTAAFEEPSHGLPVLCVTNTANGAQSTMPIGRRLLPFIEAVASASAEPPPGVN